jgi:hypothetical protein
MFLKDTNAFTSQELKAQLSSGKRLNPVYIGYFLNKSGSNKLKEIFNKLYLKQNNTIREKEQFGHITLKFSANDPKLLLYVLNDDRLPKQIDIQLKRLYFDDGISAFTVDIPPILKTIFKNVLNPHITAYHSNKRQPFQSNKLIEKGSMYIDLEKAEKDGILTESDLNISLYLGIYGNMYKSPLKLKQGMIKTMQQMIFPKIWEKEKKKIPSKYE